MRTPRREGVGIIETTEEGRGEEKIKKEKKKEERGGWEE